LCCFYQEKYDLLTPWPNLCCLHSIVDFSVFEFLKWLCGLRQAQFLVRQLLYVFILPLKIHSICSDWNDKYVSSLFGLSWPCSNESLNTLDFEFRFVLVSGLYVCNFVLVRVACYIWLFFFTYARTWSSNMQHIICVLNGLCNVDRDENIHKNTFSQTIAPNTNIVCNKCDRNKQF